MPSGPDLLAGYVVGAGATFAAVLAGGTRHTGLALAIVVLAVAAAGSRMRMPVALATGAMSWLFYDGFVIGRHAVLAWRGPADLWALAAAVGAGLAGSAFGIALRRGGANAGAGARDRVRAGRSAENVVSLADVRRQRAVRRPAG